MAAIILRATAPWTPRALVREDLDGTGHVRAARPLRLL